jgi:hypothetical protein
MTISNDKQFKAALAALNDAERRHMATLLVEQVLDLCDDSRVRGALDLARRADAGSAELSVVAAGVNSARVESYTQCGHDTNWTCQAGHFVARAAQECVKPVVDLTAVWEAAMQSRMARICQTLAAGEGTDNHDAEAQYRALEAFLKAKESAS